jgi:hypothetical protein
MNDYQSTIHERSRINGKFSKTKTADFWKDFAATVIGVAYPDFCLWIDPMCGSAKFLQSPADIWVGIFRRKISCFQWEI